MRIEPVAPLLLAMVGLMASLPVADASAQSTAFESVSAQARTHVMLAESYLAAGDLSAALDRATQAVKRDPRSAEAHAVLALVQDRINRPKQAQASFDRALKLAPDNGAVLNAYGVWLCQQGRFDQADAQFGKALEDRLYKSTLLVLHNAGRCAIAAQAPDVAERHLRAALDINPQDAVALETLALLQLKKGDPLRARAFIQRREAVAPATAEMLLLAASIEAAAGAENVAAQYRRRLQTEFPDFTPPNQEGPDPP